MMINGKCDERPRTLEPMSRESARSNGIDCVKTLVNNMQLSLAVSWSNISRVI